MFSFPRRPDRFCGPPSLLSKEYLRLFPWGVKRPVREADRSPPASAEIKKMWIYTSTLQYAFMRQLYLFCTFYSRLMLSLYNGNRLSGGWNLQTDGKTYMTFPLCVLFMCFMPYLKCSHRFLQFTSQFIATCNLCRSPYIKKRWGRAACNTFCPDVCLIWFLLCFVLRLFLLI
jgi:hypothetical protein